MPPCPLLFILKLIHKMQCDFHSFLFLFFKVREKLMCDNLMEYFYKRVYQTFINMVYFEAFIDFF